MPSSDVTPSFRFADFELDLSAYELRRRGRPVKLERRPMDLLILLLQRKGQLVSRSDIVEKLWGKDIFVDVETGVNTAIRKVRVALGDDPDSPAYIETVPGKGYRFIATVLSAAPAIPDAPRLMLAVLPFENLGAPDREYLADGLTEEIIAAVGHIDPRRMSVIGRTSVIAYKHSRKTLAQIGAELGASYILEGSVRTETARLRITARLIRVSDQVQMWSDSYDSELSHILDLERELATAIAEQVRLSLSPETATALARRRTQNPAAYDLYLRGRHYWNQLTPATTRRAVECYRQAVQLDPHYALAWSGLSDAYASSPINSDAPPLDVFELARDAANRAVTAAPDLAEAQTSLGFMNLFLGWDWSSAETSLRTAISLDSNYPLAYRMLGVLLAHMNRYDESVAYMRRARELDPQYAMHHALSAQAAFMGRDFETAVRHARQAIVVNPDFWIGHLQLGQALGPLGHIDAALQEFQAARRLSNSNSKSLSYAGNLLARAGRHDEARELLQALTMTSTERYVPPSAFALIYIGLGDTQRALDLLQDAYVSRDVHLIFLPSDERWDPLRADPAFNTLIRRCGFADH